MYDPFGGIEVSEEASTLPRFLNRILERVVTVYQSHGIPLPDRQYWTVNPGQSPWDCAQVVVALQNLNLGVPGDASVSQAQNCDLPTSATVSITILRPAAKPGGSPYPSAESIQTHGFEPAVDAWILQRSLPVIDAYPDEFGGGPGRGVISTTRILGAQGGFHGVEMLLTLVVS